MKFVNHSKPAERHTASIARTALIGVVTAAALVGTSLVGGASAQAATSAPETPAATVSVPIAAPPKTITPAMMAASYRELKASGLPSVRSVQSGKIFETFSVMDGISMSFPVVSKLQSTNLSFGGDGIGPYISFNRWDQGALSAGAGYLLVGAMCVPGPVTCGVTGLVITVATAYIASRGLCPAFLRVHYLTLGYPTCNRTP